MSIKRQIENASKEISNWPDWKKEAFGIKSMTDNPNIIKEALEAGRKNTIALCKRLDLTDEQTKECLKPFDDALALIEKSEVRYTDEPIDSKSGGRYMSSVGTGGMFKCLVIPLEQEQSE